MADEKDIKQTQVAFESLCSMLDSMEWHYKKKTNDIGIECKAHGDDLPIDVDITIDADRKLIILLSQLPFTVPEDKRIEVTKAVSSINWKLIDGSIDYNMQTGHILFRMTSSFRDSLIGESAFGYLLFCACDTVDKFNDKLLMVTKGVLSADEFIKELSD